MNKFQLNFKFKPAKLKAIKPKTFKSITNLIRGVCRLVDENYKIEYNGELYDVTERSNNLKGVQKIFTKKPDKKGRYTSLIRSKEFAYAFPVSSDDYSVFCRNHIYEGYLVSDGEITLFDVKEECGIEGYEQASYYN